MDFPMTPQYKSAIQRQYIRNMSRYPLVQKEVEAYLQGKPETFCLGMRYLYGHMTAQDVLSASVDVIAGYVQATLQACRQIDYLKAVPPEIFYPYVLQHRVNSEHLDGSRLFLLGELLPYVQGKSVERAALNVNYWCYAHATYTPADDRTLGPLGVLNRTLGRCGEESVLLVAALRSVGIPARQCYCPRWSHCDDNHAWVEVWVDGDWHYMGACEPEPVLDRGWFTAAASRAMLVDTKCWADWEGDKPYKIVNCTARYTDPRVLTVQVKEDDLPAAGAWVRFQIVNYSQLCTLWQTKTDAWGFASFETGPGDLLVYAKHGKKAALEKVDLRKQNAVVLELKSEFPEQMTVDLVPPEDNSGVVPYEVSAYHEKLLKQCQAHLTSRRERFSGAEYMNLAAFNAQQIRLFLEDGKGSLSQKEQLLNTLRPKDFVDITYETLADALETANAARGEYPEDIFRDYILAPRVADEMLLPQRRLIRGLFPGGFANPEDVLAWMHEQMQILPDEGVENYAPSAYGCLRCRQVPAFAFDMVCVSLCRAFCFPARLNPHTGKMQWMDRQGVWHCSDSADTPVNLTLTNPAGKKMRYFEHFTLGVWDGNDFLTLQYPGLVMEKNQTFSLQPGFYRIMLTTRQIDGTASVAIHHLRLRRDETLSVMQPEDQTPRRLKKIPLALPEGPLRDTIKECPGKNMLLIFAEPGSEPTEHLLREMLDWAKDFRKLACRILLLVKTRDALAHPTVQRLKTSLPEMELSFVWDTGALTALHRQMQVGDLRLPLVICADAQGYGVYADANYRIGMAQTLLEIQKLLAGF